MDQTPNPDSLLWDEQIEAARLQFPELVGEFERVRRWVEVCVSPIVAARGGQAV